jgi:transposase-like protein
VFTDLAVYYPKVITSVFSGTDHQLCLIHGLRTLFKEFNKIRFRYHKLLGNWKDQTHILTTLKENIRWRQKTHSKKNSKLRKLLTQRTDLYLQLGISENQKGIYQQYPETFKLMEKINARRAEVRSMGQTLMNNYVKRAKCQQELVYLEVEKNARWAEYMESRRLWTRFKSLLQGNFEDFQNAWKRMTEILRKAHKKKNLRLFVAKIQHLMKDFPNLFTLAKDHKNHVLSPNFWNTNRVESFNGIFRLFSDLRRHFPSTHQTNSLCALWQLYYNTTARRSKQGDKMSPIERFGINLHGMDWVDLLFKPLPMMSVVGDII